MISVASAWTVFVALCEIVSVKQAATAMQSSVVQAGATFGLKNRLSSRIRMRSLLNAKQRMSSCRIFQSADSNRHQRYHDQRRSRKTGVPVNVRVRMLPENLFTG
jgi:hypothetical protein